MSKSDVNFTIGADGSAFAGTLKTLAKDTQRALSSIGQMFFGIQGIVAGLKTGFGSLSGKAAEVENVAASLGVLLRNQTEADSLTSSLQRLATNGVIGFNELHRAARPLSNVFSSGDDIAKYVSIFADIAAGSKVPIDTMARMVSRLGDMGKAEFTELANNGVPVFEMLSRVTGHSADALRKMSAEGKITKEQLLAAFELMTQKGERFYKMNATLSNTTAGSWATLKASVDECLAEFGKPINDALRPMLQDLSSWLQENKGELTSAAGTLMQVLQTAGSAVTVVLTPLRVLYELSSSSLGSLGGALVTLSAGMAGFAVMTGRAWGGMHVGPITYRRVVEGSMAGVSRAGTVAAAALRTSFSVAWGAVTTVTRVACGVIKAALISTGIGALVWLIGEGVAAVYSLVTAQDGVNDALEAENKLRETAEAAASRMAEVEAARAEDATRTAEALQKQADLTAQMADTAESHFRAQHKRDINALKDEETKRQRMMGLYGFSSRAQVDEALRETYLKPDKSAEDVKRYKELLELQSFLTESVRKEKQAARKAEAEAKEARQKAAADYQRRREEQEIKKWEEGATLAEKRAYYFGTGSVQLTPGEVSVAQVRADMDALAAQDALANAPQIARMEQWLEKVDALQKAETDEAKKQEQDALERQRRFTSARVELVQGSLASVGGGGASIRIGDKQYEEARRHTELLKDIREALSGPQSKKLLAVLA